MIKVTWLDVHVPLGEPPQEYTRRFTAWKDAEKFVMKLQRKYPTPIEISEEGA